MCLFYQHILRPAVTTGGGAHCPRGVARSVEGDVGRPFHEFDANAVSGTTVEKGDARAAGTGSWLLVGEWNTGGT